MRDRVFYSICFGFIFGVFLRSFIFLDLYLLFLFSTISFGLILFFILISKNNLGILFSVFILSFSLGVFRFTIADITPPYIFEIKIGQKVSLIGILVDEPNIGENNQKLIVKIQDIKILVSTNLEQDFKYGDEINFIGKLQKPQNFLTDQGKVFDYVNYLRQNGIFYVVNYGNVQIVSHGHGNKIKSFLFSVKNKFLEKINGVIKSPESLLMSGLILGEKASFSKELRESFVNTGTIHIVALSGYNVMIVAEWFMSIFVFMPQNLTIYMGILAIILFILMAGGRIKDGSPP